MGTRLAGRGAILGGGRTGKGSIGSSEPPVLRWGLEGGHPDRVGPHPMEGLWKSLWGKLPTFSPEKMHVSSFITLSSPPDPRLRPLL